MSIYRTLLGEDIDLAGLELGDAELGAWLAQQTRELIAQAERRIGEVREGGGESYPLLEAKADGYAVLGRRELRARFPLRQELERAFAGSLGALFRDGYYRLLGFAIQEEAMLRDPSVDTSKMVKTFITTLRHDPVRILIDQLLMGWESQQAFARTAEIDKSVLTRVRQSLRPSDSPSSPGIAHQKFRHAYEQLHISVAAVGAPTDHLGFALGETRSPRFAWPTARERDLSRAVVVFLIKLGVWRRKPEARWDGDGLREVCREFTAALCHLYHVPDIGAASRIFDFMVGDLAYAAGSDFRVFSTDEARETAERSEALLTEGAYEDAEKLAERFVHPVAVPVSISIPVVGLVGPPGHFVLRANIQR